jgi:exonuclease III
MNITRIASININGIRANTRVGMMQDFVRTHDLDIILVQEVTAAESVDVAGYVSHINIGSEMRGTAILAKKTSHTHGHRLHTIWAGYRCGV